MAKPLSCLAFSLLIRSGEKTGPDHWFLPELTAKKGTRRAGEGVSTAIDRLISHLLREMTGRLKGALEAAAANYLHARLNGAIDNF